MTKKTIAIIIFCITFLNYSFAQKTAIENSINAFEQCLIKKDAELLKPHLSDQYKMGKYSGVTAQIIIPQILKAFPVLLSLKTITQDQKSCVLNLNFEKEESKKTNLTFDENGKIVYIQLFTDLISKAKTQNTTKQQKSIKQPTLNELAKKYPPKKVEFKSKDGLLVTGNLYEIGKDKPIILLCHQARYNKFEYADIAPKLNSLGYNCLAIDQRSGGTFAEKVNETNERAAKKGITNITYLDAEQDITAAVDYLSKKYNKKVTVWGSSYSSGLALYVSAENSNVNASISFSPGDYFDKKEVSLKKTIASLEKPFFITSSKAESPAETYLLKGTKLTESKIHFIPKSDGFHGSKALWNGQKGAEEYWIAIKKFLTIVYPKQ